jgi:hypothetical protein
MDKIRRNDLNTERSIADVGDSGEPGREGTRGTDAALTVRSRVEAREKGLKRYFTGEPCSKGHIAERGVASRACLKCVAINQTKFRENPENRTKKKAWAAKPDVRIKRRAQARNRHRENPFVKREYDRKRWHEDIEFRVNKTTKRSKRWREDSELRAKRARQANKLYHESPKYRAKILSWFTSRTLENQAQRAAALLTETLGIPHTVVKMEDGTFQPVASALAVSNGEI